MKQKTRWGFVITSMLMLWMSVGFAASVPYKLVNPGTESGWNCDPRHGGECLLFSVEKASYDNSSHVFSMQPTKGAPVMVFPPFLNNQSTVYLTNPAKPNQVATITLTYNPADLTVTCNIQTVTSDPQHQNRNPLYVLTGAVFQP